MKHIAILGSTGSIGTQALDVVRAHPDLFSISVLAAHSNDQLLERQIDEFNPTVAVLSDDDAFNRLRARRQFHSTELLGGRQSLIDAATLDDVDLVLTSLSGFAGLEPTVAAINSHKNIALANKETLVAAGELVMRLASERGVKILPVDSEHGAFFQCLNGENPRAVSKLLLTASGGPFRGRTRAQLANVTVEQVLAHPTWNMGRKITVDSASLVNKGLEVIEAKHLYNVDYDQIQVVVHPQSIVHSMVEFVDGSIIAQLAAPDMRLPIQYAFTYPERLESKVERLDFWSMRDLTFEAPDLETFRGLKLAYEVGRRGGSAPCVFNAANEIAVGAFLEGRIKFLDIYSIIEDTLDRRPIVDQPSIENLIVENDSARNLAASLIKHRS